MQKNKQRHKIAIYKTFCLLAQIFRYDATAHVIFPFIYGHQDIPASAAFIQDILACFAITSTGNPFPSHNATTR